MTWDELFGEERFTVTPVRQHGRSLAEDYAYATHVRQTYLPWPSRVIFHPPATIVMWNDNTKTVVKCMEGEEFNPEVGLAMCLAKYIFGKRYKKWFRDALKKGGWNEHRHDEDPQDK